MKIVAMILLALLARAPATPQITGATPKPETQKFQKSGEELRHEQYKRLVAELRQVRGKEGRRVIIQQIHALLESIAMPLAEAQPVGQGRERPQGEAVEKAPAKTAAPSSPESSPPIVNTYWLTPGTTHNQLELTVANESSSEVAQAVEVELIRYPKAISFAPSSQLIEAIDAGKEATARFTFDVGESPTASRIDTLLFQIRQKSGAHREKMILVGYAKPVSYALQQNYPNPFNPTTVVRYQLPAASNVRLVVYDILGREVKTLVDENQPAGYYGKVWDATNQAGSKVSSGMYIYRLEATPTEGRGSYSALKKMILLK